MRSIARILNLDFRTVRKYIHMEKDQILTIRKTFVDYTVYLDDLIEGYRKGESLSLIFRRIKIKGFKGSLRGLTIRFGKLYKGRMERRVSCVLKKETIKFPRIFSCRKSCIYLTNKTMKKYCHQLRSDGMNISEKKIRHFKVFGTCQTTSDQFLQKDP